MGEGRRGSGRPVVGTVYLAESLAEYANKRVVLKMSRSQCHAWLSSSPIRRSLGKTRSVSFHVSVTYFVDGTET